MRPPNIHSVVALATFLLFSCLLGSATGLPRQQHSGGLKVVRRDDFIEAHQPAGDGPTGYYGPPPPYYTGEPVISTDPSSYPTLEESTASPTSQTEPSSKTDTTSQPKAPSQYTTVSFRSETDTAMVSADSSAKAGSTTSSETASTVRLTASSSVFLSESIGAVSSTISIGQTTPILSNSSSIPSTHSSPGTDLTSDDSSATGMVGTTAFETDFSSVAASSVTFSSTLTETETITESLSRADASSNLEASGVVTVTDLTSSNAETESLSGVVTSTSYEDSTTNIQSITTTETFNVTVTVSPVKSSDSGLTPPSRTYLTSTDGSSRPSASLGISSDFLSLTLSVPSSENISGTMSPAQNSSRSLTEGLTSGTVSEEYPTSGSLASGIIRTITTQSTLVESVSVFESTESTSITSNVSLAGSVSVTATTYLTSTIVTSAAPTDFSMSSKRLSSTVVASNGSLSDAGTEGFSTTVISKTTTVSSIVSTSGGFTTPTFTWFTMNSSASASTFTLSGSLEVSEPAVSETYAQISSETLFDSTALPINATSQESTASFTVITVSEGSVVTVFPGDFTPTGSITGVTNSSVSTEYPMSTTARFNSSTTSQVFSSSLETSSSFDWPIWTLTEPRTSETTLDFPSISMPTSEFSIITTPLIPPNVTTTSTLDSSTLGAISVIKTTWTSTITTSIAPTNLTQSTNVTVAHTSSGYNFSKTLGSEWSTFSSLSTSFASLPGISTTIITRQPTDVPFPFPTNTTISWQSMASSGSLSQSVKTLTSQGPESTWSAESSGFSSSVPNGDGTTAPYGNSTSTTTVGTYPTSSGVSLASTVAVTTYRSWNTTSTTWWLTDTTTVRATVMSTLSQDQAWNSTRTETKSTLSAETHTLSAISNITPPFPSSLNGTLTSISDSTRSQTFTDVSLTIVTPSFSGSFNSSTISLSLTTTPPFPLPSNSTATGTGVPPPPSGTGTRPTFISSSGDFSAVGATSTPTISTTYYTPNTTLPRTTVEFSTSSSSANTPWFPISNSTVFTVTKGTGIFSSISSWTPNPSPWTTWPTWTLTAEPGSGTSTSASVLTTDNSSKDAPPSTSYTRTTTVLVTTTLSEPSTSLLTTGNSTNDASKSTSYTRTTTVLVTTTWTGSNTSRVSGAAISTSTTWVSSATWANTTSGFTDFTETATVSLSTLPSLSAETSGTLLTASNDLTRGPSTTIASSALTPFPVSNSTSVANTLTDTCSSTGVVGTTSPCKSTTTATTSSTCTDSHYYLPSYPPSSTISTSTDCSTATGGITSSWSYSSVSTAPGHASLTCNTTSTMSSYSAVHWSNRTHTFGVKDTSTYQPLTTLITITTMRGEESGSAADSYPTPTDRVAPSDSLPDDPNFPWGNDSPIHRHQNVSELGIGTGDGGLSTRTDWRLQWENVKDRLKGLWHGQALETGG